MGSGNHPLPGLANGGGTAAAPTGPLAPARAGCVPAPVCAAVTVPNGATAAAISASDASLVRTARIPPTLQTTLGKEKRLSGLTLFA